MFFLKSLWSFIFRRFALLLRMRSVTSMIWRKTFQNIMDF